MSYAPEPSGLLLPVGMRRPAPLRRREERRTWTLANGGEVRLAAVWMGAQGWQHEVTASWDRRGDDGQGERAQDALWTPDQLEAERLARAAADALGRDADRWPGLSPLRARLSGHAPLSGH